MASVTHKIYVTFDTAQGGYPCILVIERGCRGDGLVSLNCADETEEGVMIIRRLEVSALREILKLADSLPPPLTGLTQA